VRPNAPPLRCWPPGYDHAPPAQLPWRNLGVARHTFTHFHLNIEVLFSDAPCNPQRGAYLALDPADLPTLMRKAYQIWQDNPTR
ncbi:MAG: hypothetical protein ACK4SS_05850, partial [Cypionkella sp.]